MSLEADLFDALKTLVTNRVYPDIAPSGALRPYITYQQVGGTVVSFLESAHPGKRNARIQINAWATSRAASLALIRSAEVALINSTVLRGAALSASVSIYEPDTLLYGARQDFSFWY